MEPVWRCWEKRKHRSDNTSGFRGVYQLRNGKYRATIGFKGKRFYIGTFVDYQDAVQARQEAENTIHEGFVRAWYSWNRQAEKDPGWARNNTPGIRDPTDQRRVSGDNEYERKRTAEVN